MGSRLFDKLGVVFDFRFWLRNEPVSHEWSDALEVLLDEHRLDLNGQHTAWLGGCEVWICNRFYAFGQLYRNAHGQRLNLLPRRKTALRLWAEVQRAQNEDANMIVRGTMMSARAHNPWVN